MKLTAREIIEGVSRGYFGTESEWEKVILTEYFLKLKLSVLKMEKECNYLNYLGG